MTQTSSDGPATVKNTKFIDCGDGERLAYAQSGRPRTGKEKGSRTDGPNETGVVWCGGLHSDMAGTKAAALAAWADKTDTPFTRFDYYGHGASTGDFAKGTISRWRDDALAILDHIATGPQVLVGSSMGGWVSALVACARPAQIRGIVFVAPAPDFTEDLMWQQFSDEIKHELRTQGSFIRPSEYDDEGYEISLSLIEDGRKNLVLREPIPFSGPVRILHGLADPDVPWQHSLKLIDALQSDDVAATFVKGADHRVSDAPNLARLIGLVEEVLALVS